MPRNLEAQSQHAGSPILSWRLSAVGMLKPSATTVGVHNPQQVGSSEPVDNFFVQICLADCVPVMAVAGL